MLHQPDVQVISGNDLGYLQRWIALKLVEHNGDGVTEGLSEESAAQMPHVSGPHTLDPVAVNELAEHRLYASTDAPESHGALWMRVATGMFEKGLKVHLNTSQRACVISCGDYLPGYVLIRLLWQLLLARWELDQDPVLEPRSIHQQLHQVPSFHTTVASDLPAS